MSAPEFESTESTDTTDIEIEPLETDDVTQTETDTLSP